jgi:hypothetical protein
MSMKLRMAAAVLFLLPSAGALADEPLRAVATVTVHMPLAALTKDFPEMDQAFVDMQRGASQDHFDRASPVCIFVLHRTASGGTLPPGTYRVTGSSTTAQKADGRRAVHLLFNDRVLKEIICLSTLDGPDRPPTVATAREATGPAVTFKPARR